MKKVAVVLVAAALAAGVAARADEVAKPAADKPAPSPMEANKEKGAAYLATIDATDGVQKKPSGLRIKITSPGDGASPRASDTVTVHYRGTLVDGTEFDSSIKRGQPASFGLGNVIKCWTEGLQLMKLGGKATLYCPSDIAYGDRGRPPVIPPGATLVFDVELLGVQGAAR
jgi:FKBP-type peptidyl-prolyl cis-trans isomerase